MTKKPINQAGRRIWQREKTVPPSQIHELKITLHESKPPIWRQFAVPSDILLSDLHKVIQVVMGWTNSHLHQFTIPNAQPKPTKEELTSLDWQGRLERLTMQRDRCLSDPRMEIEDAEDESKVKLCEIAATVKSKFIYEYDFGDGWDHVIQVVKIGPPAEGVTYPVCISGKHACPLEDCGGMWGYYEKLEVLKNPKHEDYEDIAEWVGEYFDPERFDVEEINAQLAELRS